MNEQVDRRRFLGLAGAVAALSTAGAAAQAAGGKGVKVLGVACSPRKGMTTARAVQAVLDAAKAADPRIEVELIDLGGLKVAGHAKPQPDDDFTPLLPKLQDPAVGALIVGSPCYYRGPSSLCRAFIERCSPLRDPKMVLAGKLLGTVAVGGTRNGGHELVIASIQAAMLCFGMIPVGGLSPATPGATLLSAKDDIAADESGLDTARKLGARIAEMALQRV
ncbi:MAG: flavodoxin family protein [Ignavibacteria bacterium]|nr:flavodoxin family protein [Ignavibacteria bacterium]